MLKKEELLIDQQADEQMDRIEQYWRTVRMIEHWSALTRPARAIVRLLLGMQFRGEGSRFKGNYSDLAEAIHVKRGSSANVRRAAIDLAEREIIRIRTTSDKKNSRPESFTLLSYWQESLENNITFYKLNK